MIFLKMFTFHCLSFVIFVCFRAVILLVEFLVELLHSITYQAGYAAKMTEGGERRETQNLLSMRCY